MFRVNRRVIILEVRLNGLVLLVEEGQIRHEVFHDVHYATEGVTVSTHGSVPSLKGKLGERYALWGRG